ncbi:MAG: hypothetical protein MZV65_34575 [Chromatiales bacterium]|nr:hypothetical protein [Chromatiales bacterium]
MLQLLVARGILAETADEPPYCLPARAFDTVTITSLLDLVRGADEESGIALASLACIPEVESVLDRFDRAVRQSLTGSTLRDLVGAEAHRVRQEAAPGR